MYAHSNVRRTAQTRTRTVNNVIPGCVIGLFGALQLFLWIAIVALEIVSIYYDAGRGTVYAGIWCSPIFFITWVSTFCYLCCGKSSGCGIYLVIQNVITLIFTIILLMFTSRFVKDPCLCYSTLCTIPDWDSIEVDYNHKSSQSYCNSRTWKKLPVLKGLLASAILLLICCIVFISMYLIVFIWLRVHARPTTQQPSVAYHQQSAVVQLEGQPPCYSSAMNYSPHQHQHIYPIQDLHTPSQWPSAPPPYEMCSEKY